MAEVDFAKLLAKKVDECKPPPLLPSGTYRAIIQKYDFQTSREKGTPFLRLHLQFIGAEDDVDATELAEIDLSKVQKFANFFLTESSDYRLANFLKSLGIKTEGRSLNEAIAEMTNGTVLVPISSRLDKNDPSKAYNDVGDITGA